MLVFLFLSLAAGQLTNDICPGAQNVTDGLGQIGHNFNVAVLGYTHSCVDANDVFYVYNSTCTGLVSINASAGVALAIGVFRGRSCAGLGRCDYQWSSGVVEATAVSYAVGDKIYFAIGNAFPNGVLTAFQFNISCTPAPVAAGDICQGAIPTNGSLISVDTTNAVTTSQSQSACSGSDIFLIYTATCDGDATAVSSVASAQIGAFYPGSCDQIADTQWGQTCDSDSTTWPVRTGHSYYLTVGGSTDTVYDVTITCAASPRPANDECEGAINVASATLVIDSTNASTSIPDDVCQTYRDLWYTYNATCTGDLVVTFNSSAYAIAFAGASCGGTIASTCVYDGTVFRFPVTTDQVYTLVLGAYYQNEVLEANFSCVPMVRPANDKCVNPINVSANNSYELDFSNVTTESYVPSRSCHGDLRYDLFFRYTTCVGKNVVSAARINGSFNLEIAGFLACGLDALACESGSSSSLLSFDTPVAVPVYIGVGVFDGPPSFAQVNFTCEPATTAPTPSPTTPAPTAPTTSAAPTAQPTPAMVSNTSAPTVDENATAPTPAVSGAAAMQLSFVTAVFAFLA